jgi:hypothetical protein
MTDEINEKIINMFARHKNSMPLGSDEKIKFFAGFNYVKLTKDSNGRKFKAEKLLKYAEKCHYVVRVMREVNDEICLYNYEVTNDKLFRFMRAFENNTLNGTIIEIEKYIPEDLA